MATANSLPHKIPPDPRALPVISVDEFYSQLRVKSGGTKRCHKKPSPTWNIENFGLIPRSKFL
jgi:hypothetical protein